MNLYAYFQLDEATANTALATMSRVNEVFVRKGESVMAVKSRGHHDRLTSVPLIFTCRAS